MNESDISPGPEPAGQEEEPIFASETERRRQERRKKILQNQESRLQKILGPNSTAKDIQNIITSSNPPPPPTTQSLGGGLELTVGDNVDESPDIISYTPRPNPGGNAGQQQPRIPTFIPNFQGLATNPEVQQIQGKLPVGIHRLVLCLFGIFLPLLELNYFLIYFLIWELTVWKVFKGLQERPTQPNLIITLILVMGLTERQMALVKQLLRVSSVVWTDLCIFIFSTVIFQLFFYGREGDPNGILLPDLK